MTRNDRERDKFTLDADGNVAVNLDAVIAGAGEPTGDIDDLEKAKFTEDGKVRVIQVF